MEENACKVLLLAIWTKHTSMGVGIIEHTDCGSALRERQEIAATIIHMPSTVDPQNEVVLNVFPCVLRKGFKSVSNLYVRVLSLVV